MSQRRQTGVPGNNASERATRDQEVLRANKELAAYFKGRRTEREARAALKIIKAFVRDRERGDARSRTPLPGVGVGKPEKKAANRKAAHDPGERHRPKRRRKPQGKPSKSVAASIEPAATLEPGEVWERDPLTRE